MNSKKCGNKKCGYSECWIKAETCEKCGWNFKLQRKPRQSKQQDLNEENIKIVDIPTPTKLNKDCPKCHHPCWHRADVCENCGYSFVLKMHPDEIIEKVNPDKGNRLDLRIMFPYDYQYIDGGTKPNITPSTVIVLEPSIYGYVKNKQCVSWKETGFPFPKKIGSGFSLVEDDLLDWANEMLISGMRINKLFTTSAILSFSCYFWQGEISKRVFKFFKENSVSF